MKKLILATAVASAFLAPQAFAQSKNFEGFSAGLSASSNNGKTEFSGQAPTGDSTTTGLLAKYGWGFGGNFNLGVGLSYDLGEIKTGTASGATGVGKALTILSVEPGYVINSNLLVYVKFGYATIKGETSGSLVGSQNYDGTSAGLGLGYMLGKNWSVGAEAQQINFTGKNSVAAGGDIKPSVSTVSANINYHF
jgi:opacity protein-like surface antigen